MTFVGRSWETGLLTFNDGVSVDELYESSLHSSFASRRLHVKFRRGHPEYEEDTSLLWKNMDGCWKGTSL